MEERFTIKKVFKLLPDRFLLEFRKFTTVILFYALPVPQH